MSHPIPRLLFSAAAAMVLLGLASSSLAPCAAADEPPVINPFGPAPTLREDALPGYVELSDGTVHAGHIYLTRDKRLKVLDQKLQRQREVPLQAIKQVECKIKKEWLEKQWKFKEAASDEKMFTGHTYPTREYLHTITLRDGRQITGPLSAIVYVQPYAYVASPGESHPRPKPERYLLYKRHKGDLDQKLPSLVYVKLIKLGDEALAEGQRKAAKHQSEQPPKQHHPAKQTSQRARGTMPSLAWACGTVKLISRRGMPSLAWACGIVKLISRGGMPSLAWACAAVKGLSCPRTTSQLVLSP